jgi:hypothetical protein
MFNALSSSTEKQTCLMPLSTIISKLTLEGDSGKEVALWRLTLFSRWSKAKFKSACNFEESPYDGSIFLPCVIYINVDIMFIGIYRIFGMVCTYFNFFLIQGLSLLLMSFCLFLCITKCMASEMEIFEILTNQRAELG